jgi:hypothetical protein
MERGSEAARDQDRGRSSQKRNPVLDFRLSDFSRTDRIRLGFEIQFILKRFSRIRIKELRPAAYINIGRG